MKKKKTSLVAVNDVWLEMQVFSLESIASSYIFIDADKSFQCVQLFSLPADGARPRRALSEWVHEIGSMLLFPERAWWAGLSYSYAMS